jgi:hypothetical protein
VPEEDRAAALVIAKAVTTRKPRTRYTPSAGTPP